MSLLIGARQSIRFLIRRPLQLLLVAVVIGVGVGANVALLDLAYSTLLKPLPVGELWQLFVVNEVNGARKRFSEEDLHSLDGIDGLFIANTVTENVKQAGVSLRVSTVRTRSPLENLGWPLAQGRYYSSNSTTETVVSEEFSREFGLTLGDELLVGEGTVVVVGILQSLSRIPYLDRQLWLPAEKARGNLVFSKNSSVLSIAGLRVAPEWRIGVFDVVRDATSRSRGGLWSLQLACATLLVLAFAGAFSVCLSRLGEEAEDARTRVFLGADRGSIWRLLFIKYFLVAIVASAIGTAIVIPFSWSAARVVSRQLVSIEFGSWEILVGATFGIAFFLAGAIASAQTLAVSAILSRRLPRFAPRVVRAATVVQVGVSITLLGAALIVGGFLTHLYATDFGVNVKDLTVAEISIHPYDRQYSLGVGSQNGVVHRRQFWADLVRLVRLAPGVEDVSVSTALPVVSSGVSREAIKVDEIPYGLARTNIVSPDFFQNIGLQLTRGTPPVDNEVVINESLAQVIGQDLDPVGRTIFVGLQNRVISGVAKNIRMGFHAEPDPTVFIPNSAHPHYAGIYLLVRGGSDFLPADITRAVQSIDPQIRISKIRTFDRIMRDAAVSEEVSLLLFRSLAAFSILICVAGIFGGATQRVRGAAREIGIRMAMGAPPSAILASVAVRELISLGIGLVFGVAGSLYLIQFADRFFSNLEVSAMPVLVSAGVVVAVSTPAVLVPACNAFRVDPAHTLRVEN